MNNKYYIYSFYRFKELNKIKKIKLKLDQYLTTKIVRGTILLANEGINGSLAASKKDLDDIMRFIKKDLLNIRKLEIKVNETGFLPFNKIKVRLKKEIVTLGKGKIDIKKRGTPINPVQWNNLIQDKKTIIIDVRNQFEIDIGNFKSAINPNTNSFREFPKNFKKLNLNKNSQIAMYCTGGIRCEKASSYLRSEGYKNIFQLNGGIINYLKEFGTKNKNCHWDGECFVFDDRVTIDKKLKKGKYIQCYGCRHPITKKDTLSNKYEKGVSCHNCYDTRNDEQKKKSRSRQTHIEKAKKDGSYNIYIKKNKTSEIYS